MSNTVTHLVENRYYLDLNRNGFADANGWVTIWTAPGMAMAP